MDNEELVARIQAGERELTGILLQKNKGMIYHVAYHYWPLAQRNGGAGLDDLTQAAALGMLEAITAWEPERGSFLTLAVLYMKRQCRMLLGMATSKQRIENTLPVVSLSAPLREGEDGDLYDVIADREAIDPDAAALKADMCRRVHEAVDDLPDDLKDFVQRVYFQGESGYHFPSKGQSLRERAHRALRKDKRLQGLIEKHEAAPYRRYSLQAFKSSHESVVEIIAIYREQLRERAAQVADRPQPPVNEIRPTRRQPGSHHWNNAQAVHVTPRGECGGDGEGR